MRLFRMRGLALTPLGRFRAELAHASKHHLRVALEWDRALRLLKGLDFEALEGGEHLHDLSAEVEVWNDLTLDPPRRVSRLCGLGGLPRDQEECYDYLHRVFVGYDPGGYLSMCDQVEDELDRLRASVGPSDGTELRDRLVELMELGVRSSTRCLDWLKKKVRQLEDGS